MSPHRSSTAVCIIRVCRDGSDLRVTVTTAPDVVREPERSLQFVNINDALAAVTEFVAECARRQLRK